MAEEEPQKEEQNQEQNAEATEAVEAGAEAAEEAAVAEPKAPSMLVPMLLSAVITVAGVGVMVVVILPKQIKTAIAAASHHDGNSTGAHGKDGHGEEGHGEEGHGEEGHGEGDSHGEGEGEGDTAGTEEDDPKKPEPIVAEGENIVINPAGSGGTRYLLVEIFLLRKDVEDKKFPAEIKKNAKLLEAVTVETLSAQSAQALSDPATKERLKHTLKLMYEDKLGSKHPIKELIVSKWIMQ